MDGMIPGHDVSRMSLSGVQGIRMHPISMGIGSSRPPSLSPFARARVYNIYCGHEVRHGVQDGVSGHIQYGGWGYPMGSLETWGAGSPVSIGYRERDSPERIWG